MELKNESISGGGRWRKAAQEVSAPSALIPSRGTFDWLGDKRMTSSKVGPIVGRPLKLLFCGEEFPDGARCTAASLADCPDVQVTTCSREEVPSQIVDADVAIPLMTRLDAATIAKGTRLRLVLQFGVGLEGVDMQACSERGIMLARIPSERTGNAASTAELAVYLLLAALRRHNQLASSLASQTLGAPLGRQLKGLRVLIVGWGNIARELAGRVWFAR